MPIRNKKSFTVKAFIKKMEKGEITFDNIIQRNLVWEKKRKSLFIHSLITQWMPCPPFYCIQHDDNGKIVYDCIEGKQRSNDVKEFVADGFALTDVPEFDEDGIPFSTEDGELIGDINGKKFSELPESFQEHILDYSFDVVAFDNLPSALVAEIFLRINSGKPLSSIELAWVKALSKDQILAIVSHPLFAKILTPAVINKYGDIKIAMYAWAALYQPIDEVSFESKIFRPLVASTEITDEQTEGIMSALTKFENVYDIINARIEAEENEDEKKWYGKILKKISTQTHLLSILKIVKRSVDENISDTTVANWCLKFFAGTARASVNETYNDNAFQGTNANSNIKKRFSVVESHFEHYLSECNAQSAQDETESA